MDEKLRSMFKYITKDCSPSQEMYNNIIYRWKGDKCMNKRFNFKKLGVCLLAAGLLLTAGATAAGRFASYAQSGSNRRELIDHVPSPQELEEAVGYVPKYREKLGDYTLVSAQPSDGSYYDDNGVEMYSGREIDFNYENGDKKVTLFTSQSPAQFSPTGEIVDTVESINIYYSKTINKFVPPDYVPTPEEKQLVEEGSLNIGYGASEIQVMESEYLTWTEEGITYGILTMDNVLGEEALKAMAREVIGG